MTAMKLKAFLLVIVVFALGLILGASVATTIVSRRLATAEPPSPRDGRHHMMDTFKSRLQLSPAQAEKLQVIFDDTHQQFRTLQQTVKPQYDAIRDQMRNRVREMLDERQKKEFAVMVEEFEKREKEHTK